MLDHAAARLALRNLLLTLSVCTTGSTSLAASAAGGTSGASAFTRTAGSFLTDGFAVGMEVAATGFATSGNNTHTTITDLSALTMTVSATLTDDVAASGRTLAVGLPQTVIYEGIPGAPTAATPYATEQYLPGPVTRRTVGTRSTLEAMPMYVVGLAVPIDTGDLAASSYVNALLTLFAPGTSLTVGSDALVVRGDPAPFAGQLLRTDDAWMQQTVTVPLRSYTANAI